MKRSSLLAAAGGFTVVLLAVGTFGVVRSGNDADQDTRPPTAAEPAALATARGATLDALIADLTARMATTPDDYVASATLGLAYVQQARVTANGDLYDLAAAALDESLEVNSSDNFLAYAGHSALSSATHDFGLAKEYAEQGLEVNPFSALLYGVLSDAELQLGDYDAAFAAVQQMIDLSPDSASLSRASYTWEIRGNIAEATRLMQRALDDAPTPADRSFALLQLGDLAFNDGDAATALTHYIAALGAQPDSAAALSGKARAEAALGNTETALTDYETLIARRLEPFYILQYADFLQSLGRDADAAEQYRLYEQQESEFAAQEVLPDATFTLFFADHGKPDIALEQAQGAVEAAPFLDTHDAYAWALHANGRHEEAWQAMEKALALNSRNALFHYHAGMIRQALGDFDGAREHLELALEINPHFNPAKAQVAEATLAELER